MGFRNRPDILRCNVFPIFASHRSSAFLRDSLLTVSEIQLIAVLHAVSLVSHHNFLSLRLCFKQSIYTRQIVIQIRKSDFTYRQSTCRGDKVSYEIASRFISFSARVKLVLRRNYFRGKDLKPLSICKLSAWFKKSLALTWSSMCDLSRKYQRKWRHSNIWMEHRVQNVTISLKNTICRTVWRWNVEVTSIKEFQLFLTWTVWNLTIPNRVLGVQITCQ
jgi:hypothetical protein